MNRFKLKICTEQNYQPDETTGGVVLEKTANGLTASLIWGEF